jgi:zinc/manganese transport system permease protein
LVPSLRSTYLSEKALEQLTMAERDAIRYKNEAVRLNVLEASSRAGERMLDDEQVRRISSFTKSYHEMRRGEEFVQREVVARGRERARLAIAGLLIVLALPFVPGLARAFRRRKRP